METGVEMDRSSVHLELNDSGSLFYPPLSPDDSSPTISIPCPPDRRLLKGPEGPHAIRVKDAANRYTPSEWLPFDLAKGPPVDVELKDSIGAVGLGQVVSNIRLALRDVGQNECVVPSDVAVTLASDTPGLKLVLLHERAKNGPPTKPNGPANGPAKGSAKGPTKHSPACLTLPSFAVVESRPDSEADGMDTSEDYDGSQGLRLQLTLRSPSTRLTLSPPPIPVSLNPATRVDALQVHVLPSSPSPPSPSSSPSTPPPTAGSPLHFKITARLADGVTLDPSSPAFHARFHLSCSVLPPLATQPVVAQEEAQPPGTFCLTDTKRAGEYTILVALAYRLAGDTTHLAHTTIKETVTLSPGPPAELAWVEGKRAPTTVAVDNENSLTLLQASAHRMRLQDSFGNAVSPSSSVGGGVIVARWDARGGPALQGATGERGEVTLPLQDGMIQTGMDVAVQPQAAAVTGSYKLLLSLRRGAGEEEQESTRPLSVDVRYVHKIRKSKSSIAFADRGAWKDEGGGSCPWVPWATYRDIFLCVYLCMCMCICMVF
jgi:hypothetical protein